MVLFGNTPHASLWNGTASSWVDVHPIGFSASSISSASDGYQAGYVLVGGLSHAYAWKGAAGFRVDLHAFLPNGFGYSFANGIFSDGTSILICGYAKNQLTDREEAILWTRPTCAADFNRSGGAMPLTVQDIFDFLNAWFESDARADFNGRGLSIQDIVDFLNAWFVGC